LEPNALPLPDIPGVSAEAWATLPATAQAILLAVVTHYEARLQAQEKHIREQEERIRVLTARLNKDSSNSSKPPSSDPPRKKAEKKKASGNAPGGKPGHTFHARPLIPLEQVDYVFDHSPKQCTHCGNALTEDDARGDVQRHQSSKLPPIKPVVTEHRACNRRCRGCGTVTHGSLPSELSTTSVVCPNAQALIGTLVGRYQLSRRDAQECMEHVFGIRLCLGTIQRIVENIGRVLAPAYAEAVEAVRQANVRYFDETSWRVKGRRSYLWIGVGMRATALKIAPTRGAIVLREWIGQDVFQKGYTVSDRYAAYNIAPMELRGICNAHIRRDFKQMRDCGDWFASIIGGRAVSLHEEYFVLRHRFQAQEITHAVFLERFACIKQELHDVLERGTNGVMGGMCAEILKHESALWRHVDVPEMEPTNNIAERGLRPAVILRKTSFGTQSTEGSRFVERSLTVWETCKQNARNFIEFLGQTVRAALDGQAPPKLLLDPGGGALSVVG
jgi:transposase